MNWHTSNFFSLLTSWWLPGICTAALLLGGCSASRQITFDGDLARVDALPLARMNDRLADRSVIVHQVNGPDIRGTFLRSSPDSCYLLVDDSISVPMSIPVTEIESLEYRDHWGGLALGVIAGFLGMFTLGNLLVRGALALDTGLGILLALGSILFGLIGAPIIGGVNGIPNTLVYPRDSRAVGRTVDNRALFDAMARKQGSYYNVAWRPHEPSKDLLKAWARHREKLFNSIPEGSPVLQADTVVLFESVNYAGDIAGYLISAKATYSYRYERGDSLVVFDIQERAQWSPPYLSTRIVDAAYRADPETIQQLKPGPERLDERVSRIHVFRLLNRYGQWRIIYFEFTDFPEVTTIHQRSDTW